MTLSRLQDRLLAVFALKPGQGARTLLVALYLFTVLAAYVLLKVGSKSLFLKIGVVYLPFVTITVALSVGVFVGLYIRLSRRVGPVALIVGTLVFVALNLVVFWWLFRLEQRWVYFLFSIWVGMIGVIVTTQVWTLANDVFTTREAKRAFGLVGTAGLAGGFCGAALGGFLIGGAIGPLRVTTVDLLLVASVMLLAAAGLVLLLARYRLPVQTRGDEQPAPRRLSDTLRIIAASPHLKLVAALVIVTALATKMVDFQFSAVIQEAYPVTDERTKFLAYFASVTTAIGFLIQSLLTSRLLTLMGLGGTILIFPIAVTIGTVALIPALGLAWAVRAAGLAYGSDQTLKHSLDRSTRELAYLPVSRAIKAQAKSVIDMIGDRTGDGLSGLLQLGIIVGLSLLLSPEVRQSAGDGLAAQTERIFAYAETNGFELVRPISMLNLVFLAAWLFVANKLRRSYVSELNRSIEEGRVEVGSWHEALAGAETLDAVKRGLESEQEPQVLAALELVASNPQWDLTEPLCRLAKQGVPEVRARALAILLAPDNPDLPAGVSEAFEHEDQTLLSECIDLQLSQDPDDRRRRAEAILARAGGPARGAWIALMVRRLGPEFRPVTRGLLEQLLDPDSPPDVREVAATSIGMLPADSGNADLLPALLEDSDAKVAAAAIRSTAAIGGEDQLGALVSALGRTSTRKAARQALQARGNAAVQVLVRAARDAGLDRRSKLRIPSVLGSVDSAECLPALSTLLASEDPRMSQAATEALYQIRLKKPDLSLIPQKDARNIILLQARKCSRLSELLAGLESDSPAPRSPARELLLASLRSSYQRHHAAIFRMLCLCYSPRHILNCKRSLLDQNLELRANAAELLDNMVPRKLWRELLPILYREEFGPSRGAGPEAPGAEGALTELARSDDAWLCACALTVIGESGLSSARRVVEKAASRDDPRVREAGLRAREQLDRRTGRMSSMTVVERVMALRAVEIFRETPPEQLGLVASIAREETFPEGHVLGRQDDPPGDLFVLLGGRVVIERDGTRLGELSRGDAIGTWALFEDEPWQVTARMAEETPLLRIDRWGFEEVLEENPEIARGLIQQLIRRLRKLAG